MELVLFAVASLAVPAAVAVIFLYLRASFDLLDLVQARHPELWERLGRPRRARIQQAQRGSLDTIQPIGPWLSWVWSGSTDGLRPEVKNQLLHTRKLLTSGAAALGAAFGCILLLVLIAS